jgi:hypothetical protein
MRKMTARFPMAKYDEEEIIKWIIDGWNFRIKTVSGKKYVTRRKGEKERGMGKFSKKLWRLISDTKEDVNTGVSPKSSCSDQGNLRSGNDFLDSLIQKNKLLESSVLMDRGVYMWTNCIYKDEDGYCIFWNWDKQPHFFRYVDELSHGKYKEKMVYINGVETSRWVYFASPWHCQSCPTFESYLTILNSAI